MRLNHIRLREFRNVIAADLQLNGNRQFFHGLNGQGKTNLLEAAGLLSAARSFRTNEIQPLIRHNQPLAAVFAETKVNETPPTFIDIRLAKGRRTILVDEAKIDRYSDFIGRYPTVTISSADIQLLRGSPGLRRRFVDLVLSFGQPEYLKALRSYHKTLQERNALLKKEGSDDEITAFDQVLSINASILVTVRTQVLKEISEHLKSFYTQIAKSDSESPDLIYKPSEHCESPQEFEKLLLRNRERDRATRSTQSGPHRDDIAMLLNSHKAVDFASEGQQRALVLALRFSQFSYFREKSGTIPVILADDILGELDPDRRQRFWEACDPDAQILATGTTLPDNYKSWQIFKVREGSFTNF